MEEVKGNQAAPEAPEVTTPQEELPPPHNPTFKNFDGEEIKVFKEGDATACIDCSDESIVVVMDNRKICTCNSREDAEGIANGINITPFTKNAIAKAEECVNSLLKKNDKLFRRNCVLEERNFVSKLNSFMFAFLAAALFFLGIGMYRAAHATPQREATAKLIEALHDFKASHDMTFTENVFN